MSRLVLTRFVYQMIPIVEIPQLIQHYASAYESCFSRGAYAHFQRYLSGLLICENKTISGINQAFVLSPRDQSSLNRFLNQARYDLDSLNRVRLDQLQANPATAMRSQGRHRGVLALDDTLLSHVGTHFDHIKPLWDHVDHRHVWAHNLVNLYYSDESVDYPISYELWKPYDAEVIEAGLKDIGIELQAKKYALKESDPDKWLRYLLGVCQRRSTTHPEAGKLYRNKIAIGMDLLRQFVAHYPQADLAITFDSWFCTPKMCAYIDQDLQRAYVGALRIDKASVILAGSQQQKMVDFIETARQAHLSGEKTLFRPAHVSFRGKTHTTYCYCKTHRLKHYGRVKLLLCYTKEALSDEPRVYITNQTHWQAATISRVYRHRWPVEPFHQQAKAQGLGKYQMRNWQAIERHVLFVVIAFSMLTLARKDPELLKKLSLNPDTAEKSIAFWRRLIKAHSLIAIVQWILVAQRQGLTWEAMIQPLMNAYL